MSLTAFTGSVCEMTSGTVDEIRCAVQCWTRLDTSFTLYVCERERARVSERESMRSCRDSFACLFLGWAGVLPWLQNTHSDQSGLLFPFWHEFIAGNLLEPSSPVIRTKDDDRFSQSCWEHHMDLYGNIKGVYLLLGNLKMHPDIRDSCRVADKIPCS